MNFISKNMAYTDNGSFSFKKEGNSAICYNKDDARGHSASEIS